MAVILFCVVLYLRVDRFFDCAISLMLTNGVGAEDENPMYDDDQTARRMPQMCLQHLLVT